MAGRENSVRAEGPRPEDTADAWVVTKGLGVYGTACVTLLTSRLFCYLQILLQKSKIEERQESRERTQIFKGIRADGS